MKPGDKIIATDLNCQKLQARFGPLKFIKETRFYVRAKQDRQYKGVSQKQMDNKKGAMIISIAAGYGQIIAIRGHSIDFKPFLSLLRGTR